MHASTLLAESVAAPLRRGLTTFITAVLLSLVATKTLAETFEFHVIGIECKLCAPPIQKALASIPGVREARVDWKKETAAVEIPAGFDKAELKSALERLGFEAVFPGETAKGFQPLPPEEIAKLDIQKFDGHESVDEKSLVSPGKTTLIDYYGDWCGPCKVLELRLQHYMAIHPDISLRRVDIGKWDNAAARQITQQGATSLPYVRVYNPVGKLLGNGGMWDELLALIEKSRETR
jgi:copper chaperone CopZ/thiol-disulfide isomerase/thioredoxin